MDGHVQHLPPPNSRFSLRNFRVLNLLSVGRHRLFEFSQFFICLVVQPHFQLSFLSKFKMTLLWKCEITRCHSIVDGVIAAATAERVRRSSCVVGVVLVRDRSVASTKTIKKLLTGDRPLEVAAVAVARLVRPRFVY
jgi:hypothetical protein